jgi:hypothetical protein
MLPSMNNISPEEWDKVVEEYILYGNSLYLEQLLGIQVPTEREVKQYYGLSLIDSLKEIMRHKREGEIDGSE